MGHYRVGLYNLLSISLAKVCSTCCEGHPPDVASQFTDLEFCNSIIPCVLLLVIMNPPPRQHLLRGGACSASLLSLSRKRKKVGLAYFQSEFIIPFPPSITSTPTIPCRINLQSQNSEHVVFVTGKIWHCLTML